MAIYGNYLIELFGSLKKALFKTILFWQRTLILKLNFNFISGF